MNYVIYVYGYNYLYLTIINNNNLVKKQKRGTVKFLNFHSRFGKVDKLDNCISFCLSYNLLPKLVKCPTCGDELTKL